MNEKREIIRQIITSMRKNRALNHHYVSSSLIEMNPTEDGHSCKEVSFVVPWQMQRYKNEVSFIVPWQMQRHNPDYF